MYVKVQYHKPELGENGYGGMEYTYRTELPLKPGDTVIAPTYRGNQRALVVAAYVPSDEIRPAWADRIRTITEYWTEEGKNG